MIEIFIQAMATALAIVAIYGVKILDMPALPTIILACAVVFVYLFTLAGGFSKKRPDRNSHLR